MSATRLSVAAPRRTHRAIEGYCISYRFSAGRYERQLLRRFASELALVVELAAGLGGIRKKERGSLNVNARAGGPYCDLPRHG